MLDIPFFHSVDPDLDLHFLSFSRSIYLQSGLSNLIGWQLEKDVSS